MRRLAHYAVYNISITGIIVLSNKMIIGIILMPIWHTISSLKLEFKRGQAVEPQTFDFPCFHYFSEHTSALKIIP